MIRQLEAVYENGVLRPLQPVSLNESEHVTIAILGPAYQELLNADLVEQARAEVAAMATRPTIEEVRAMLSTIPGSMAETIIAERGEY